MLAGRLAQCCRCRFSSSYTASPRLFRRKHNMPAKALSLSFMLFIVRAGGVLIERIYPIEHTSQIPRTAVRCVANKGRRTSNKRHAASFVTLGEAARHRPQRGNVLPVLPWPRTGRRFWRSPAEKEEEEGTTWESTEHMHRIVAGINQTFEVLCRIAMMTRTSNWHSPCGDSRSGEAAHVAAAASLRSLCNVVVCWHYAAQFANSRMAYNLPTCVPPWHS